MSANASPRTGAAPGPTLRQVSPGAIAERLNSGANTAQLLGSVLGTAAQAQGSVAQKLSAAAGIALEQHEAEGSSMWGLMRALRAFVSCEAQQAAVQQTR